VKDKLLTVINDLGSGVIVTRHDVHVGLLVLSGLVTRPEFIPYAYISTLANILKIISQMSDSALFSLSEEFTESYLQAVSSFFVRIEYEHNVFMETESYMRFYSRSSSYQKRILDMKSYSKSVWLSVENYLRRVSYRVNSISPLLEVSTTAAIFKIEAKVANTVNGFTHTINSAKDYKAQFPADLFTGTTVTDLTSNLHLISITWTISPLHASYLDDFQYLTDLLTVFIVHDKGVVEITGKVILLEIGYHLKLHNSLSESCKVYSTDHLQLTVSESACTFTSTATAIPTFASCSSCSNKMSAVILTSHLSTFAIANSPETTVVEEEHKGECIKAKKRRGHPKLQDSTGVYYLTGMLGVFILGLVLIIPLNIFSK